MNEYSDQDVWWVVQERQSYRWRTISGDCDSREEAEAWELEMLEKHYAHDTRVIRVKGLPE